MPNSFKSLVLPIVALVALFAQSVAAQCAMSCDPNQIYDRVQSSFHATVIKKSDGSITIFGPSAAPDGVASVTQPKELTPANGYNYTGSPLMGTTGSNSTNHQHFLLTSTGLYAWGNNTGNVLSVPATTAFQTIPLPVGVLPCDVKQLSATTKTLSILTNSGEVWIQADSIVAGKNVHGNGGVALTTAARWSHVTTAAAGNPFLSGVTHLRVSNQTAFAVTASGAYYTWGLSSYLGNGSAANTTRNRATLMTAPFAGVPKMIALTRGNSYYALNPADNKIYAMGDNSDAQLGQGNTAIQMGWVTVKAPAPAVTVPVTPQPAGDLANVTFLTANDADLTNGAAAAITSDGKVYAWGSNAKSMIGGNTTALTITRPRIPNGFSGTDKSTYIEVGGHTMMCVKDCSARFCYVGHRIEGSMGDSTTTSATEPAFNNTTTPIVLICGGPRFDSGDVPVSFENGNLATHSFACPMNLYLGVNTPNANNGLQRNVAANADNTGSNGDEVEEDGLATIPAYMGGGTYSLSVNAFNNTTKTANIYAWVDWNGNGLFELSEAATATLTDGTTNRATTLSWAVPSMSPGVKYIRIRLTTQTLLDKATTPTFDERSTGYAPDGEIEDFQVVYNPLYISGTILNDANGLTDNTINGTGTNGTTATPLYVNLLNSSGIVVATTTVAADGTYSFAGLAAATYTVQVTTVRGTVASASPTTVLPTNWVTMGENIGTTTGNDSTPNSMLTINLTTDVVNANFGIQQRPTANNSTATTQTNPGGTTNVSVPATAFSGSDADGTVASIFIATFPANATSITINGITYTRFTFPTTGVTIPTNAAGNPTQTITIDPFDGATTVGITYFTIDNTGTRSLNSATANIPFADLTISGTTFHDTNGGTINGTPTNTIGGNTLFANLVNPITHLIIASVAVNADGTYSFGTANGVTANTNYNIEITNTMGTVGAIIPTPILVGAINTAEGTTAAGDGAADGSVAVSVGTSSISNVNFAIGIPPVANTTSEASRVNPGAGVSVPVLATTFSGTDADGIITNIRISAFPDGAASITIGGTVYTTSTFPTTGIIIPTNAAGNPTQAIEVSPNDGAVTVSIPFFVIDNAGIESLRNGSANLPFSARPTNLPVKMLTFGAKVENCTVVLNWQTASELNTERFEVWKSTTGETFEKVGEVKAAGTTTIAQKYSFEDPKTAHYNYYQLRSVDFDGYTETFTLNNRVKVKTCFDEAPEGVTAIYPNPNSTSELTLRFSVDEVSNTTAQVVIFDLTGKTIATQNISINQGANVSTINIADVAEGMYLVQIQTANWISKGERLVRRVSLKSGSYALQVGFMFCECK
jgi:alpha-tubulin suppressor-like RCC1 family protein